MSFRLTGEHLFADNNSTNTVEFFAAANTYIDLVKKYTNDLAIQNIWKHTSHTHDPIIKQAEFFNLVSQTLHKLKENEEGSIDIKVNDILVKKLEIDLATYNSLGSSEKSTQTAYEWEDEQNNNRMHIRLLDAKYLKRVLEEAESVLRTSS